MAGAVAERHQYQLHSGWLDGVEWEKYVDDLFMGWKEDDPYACRVREEMKRTTDFRDYKTKLTRSWWTRARSIMHAAVTMPGRIVRSAMRFCRDKSALLLFTVVLSLVAVPVAISLA